MTEPQTADENASTESGIEQHKVQLESVSEGEPQDEGEVPSVTVSKPMDKLYAFALQLMEEFLARHKLEETLTAMQAELERKGIPRPDDKLWFEMHNSCRVALSRGNSSCSSTLEKLLAFCVSPKAARAAGALALDVKTPPVTLCLASPQPNSISKLKQTSFSLKQAYSQMLSPVVRPSQRYKYGAPSTPGHPNTNASVSANKGGLSSLSELEMDNSLQLDSRSSSSLGPVETKQQCSSSKKHKPKKKRNHGNDNNKATSHPSPHPSRTESSMVMAFDEQIKRDLSCGRILARELRNLRVEQAKCDSLRRSTASLEAALARHDPYAKELVRERYGFIHRVECALCTFPFLPVNLPHRVSFKCIMDLHEQWGYEAPQREIAARYRPPFCYDAVSVCRMCGPILFEHTTATPDAYSDQTMARSSSVGVLSTSKSSKMRPVADNAERRTFCSDPYALPPLFGDDVIEDGDSYVSEEVANEILRASGGGAVQESPAKAMVYSQQQTDTSAFMSSKEWEVINPMRSNIRQVMENTVKL
ncbi:hypothetical protein PPTG_01953 [Phytophthora nicotianae INRA-310]|uniref:LisH domain-containing protein n=2 Tax=Phytophthora nicotianae TaxID=4792 RepID=W2RBG8_PHYN3|nr:hypothetical protein PPTG_01953 [Phytophthora nicotianae INRA-310]ETN21870.1 hypothetical protein PPTG_01953 [Phytophthora nicotianae INRA-310]